MNNELQQKTCYMGEYKSVMTLHPFIKLDKCLDYKTLNNNRIKCIGKEINILQFVRKLCK